MKQGRLLRNLLESTHGVWILVGGAFLLRIAGIGYGLPLTLVADEPPFVLAALQMLQLHTIIPALHMDAFAPYLYYPPYLSYIYLLPFAAITGIEYLFWSGSFSLFTAHLLSESTPYFLAARCISVFVGTASVYLMYRISESLTSSRSAAFFSGFLLATSLMHDSLSMVGRHWLFVSCVLLLVLYVLTREKIDEIRRLSWSGLIASAAVGISVFSSIALVFVAFWVLCVARTPLPRFVRDRYVIRSVVLSIGLVVLPFLLYPSSSGAVGGVLLLHQGASLLPLVLAPLFALYSYSLAEPALILLALIGMGAFLRNRVRWALAFAIFFIVYAYLFATLAILEPRFLSALIPVYALLGGYAASLFMRWRWTTVLIFVLLFIPLVSSVRLSYLAYCNDSRTQARAWVLEQLRPENKIIVYSELLRLPATADSIRELRSLEKDAIRKTDEADALLNRSDIPHTLNLSYATNLDIFTALPEYSRTHRYDYLLIEPEYSNSPAFDPLIKDGQKLKTWIGFGDKFSVAHSQFVSPFWHLFEQKSLGPTVTIYKLSK